MRKVVVFEHISLDGVIQAPGSPDEDTSGDFAHGGWIAPYGDEILGTALRTQMNTPCDLLVGRTTFHFGRGKAVIRGGCHADGFQGDGKQSHLRWRDDRELRAYIAS